MGNSTKCADSSPVSAIGDGDSVHGKVSKRDDSASSDGDIVHGKVIPAEKDENPLFVSDSSRFVLFPIKHPKVWAMVKRLQRCTWIAEDLDFSGDRFYELDESEKRCITMILAFFAASDGIVMENLISQFIAEIKMPEARYFYTLQSYNEAIHSETYSLLIESYVNEEAEKLKLFKALDTIPSVGKKGEWALKWISDKRPFVQRLIAFAIVEGVFFSSSFALIFWFKKRGLVPGLTLSNEYISRDEGLHTEFACLLHNEFYADQKLDRDVVREIFVEAVDIEKEFIRDAIPSGMAGMSADKMSEYVEYVADRLLDDLGYDKIYGATNPFEFMENISLEEKTNFFESRVSQYRLHESGTEEVERRINFDTEF